MVPVSVMFGRAPGREKGEVNPPLRMLNGIQKFFASPGWDATALCASRLPFRCAEWRTSTVPTRHRPEAGPRGAYALRPPASGRRRAASPARQDLFNKLLARKRLPARLKTKRAARKFRMRKRSRTPSR
jgi:glycerol-3-phosphate O-acyltransferase